MIGYQTKRTLFLQNIVYCKHAFGVEKIARWKDYSEVLEKQNTRWYAAEMMCPIATAYQKTKHAFSRYMGLSKGK